MRKVIVSLIPDKKAVYWAILLLSAAGIDIFLPTEIFAANVAGELTALYSAPLLVTNAMANSLPMYYWPYTLVEDTSSQIRANNSSRPELLPRKQFERNTSEQSKFSSGKNPSTYESKYYFDSTAQVLRRRETVQDVELGLPRTYTLDEYLARRRNFLQNRVWDSLLTSYDLSKANSGDALSDAISKATGFTIPIPPNPLTTIFGKPEIGINVTGEVNVRAGWRWDSQNLGTVSAFGSTQSSPVFSQDINLNVSGRIGDKLKLGVDYNTRRQFEFDNRFKIGFDGYDDDIIKRVELGNVNLPIPQATLIGGGQTLFGARADLQFGPLFLKTIASQRRGERKFVNVKGGALKQRFGLRAYDYAQNHFLLDTAYKSIWEKYYENSTPIIPQNALPLSIKGDIQIWESTNNVAEQATGADAVAYADLAFVQPNGSGPNKTYPDSLKNPSNIVPGEVARGKFVQLDPSRYYIDRALGRISINNLRTDRTYAIAYRIENVSSDASDDKQYGTITTNGSGLKDTLILKLIYVPNLQPGFTTLWSRQLKNIYWIGSTNVNLTETNIGVWYFRQSNDSSDVMPGTQDKVVTVLGVDRITNGTSEQTPDGKFDIMEPSPYFDPRRGEIIFPSLEPFRNQLRKYFSSKGTPELASQYTFDAVYDTNVVVARQQTTRDRFVISGEVTGTAGNRIALGAFNLTPGSVRVTLDGRPLREGEDYIVEYYSGQLTIRNAQAGLPNANLGIEYESPDVFNLATKTLAGVRADLEPYKSRTIRSNIGGTFMHYDQALLIDRVRIGDEPVSNSMFGFDGQLQVDAAWLTKAINALPFLDTKEKSAINLRGEWAQMLPTPNKKLSDVASDRGMPVVYVDDFESAQRQISLGLSPTQWTHASPPQDPAIASDDTLRTQFRGKSFWFQYFIPRVPVTEVYPNKQSIPGRTTTPTMLINFDPATRGIYNHNPNFVDALDGDSYLKDQGIYDQWKLDNKQHIWGGMMRLLSSYSINFDAENIDYIEVMMKVEEREPGTQMFIDIGQISEDVIPNQKLDTEDGITQANSVPNNIIDEGEDVGIDGASDTDEPKFYPPNFGQKDPARDNYSFDFNTTDQKEQDFFSYNNYEGNATVAESGQFPDTEILNRNNGQSIAPENSYFSYEIKLDDGSNVGNTQIVGGANRWYLYRIPVRGERREVGKPLFSNIQYARIWFKGGKLKAQVADWRFLGSQWQRINAFQPGVSEQDSVLKVAFINREENSGPPDYYTMPPGVSAPRQLSADPTQDIRLNEHSLSLTVRDLRYGEERMAARVFRPFDMFYYKKLKFFVHGDGAMPDNVVSYDQAPAYVYMRFGLDSLNYYEYRRPLTRDWQDIEIDLESLTAIKQLRDVAKLLDRVEFPVPGDPLAKYIIKGNPTLTKILFVGYGIANPAHRFPNALTTTMWVDELRLIDPEDSEDWAAIGSADIKLADLGTVVASFNRSNPNFHKLEERFGNRIESSNWSVSIPQISLEKFLPKDFKEAKIPVTFTHTEYYEKPQFAAQNDINLNEAANLEYQRVINDAGGTPERAQAAADAVQVRSQTLRVQDSWAVTGLKLGIPVEHWLVRETFNKLVFGYSYAQSYERTPVVQERFDWRWQLNTQYAATISPDFYFDPFRWLADIPGLSAYKDARISYLPSNISAGIILNRGRITEQSRFLEFPSPVIRNFNAQKQLAFTWRLSQNGFLSPTIDYSLNSISTLVPLELDGSNRQRSGGEIFSEMFGKDGRLVNFGDETRYVQNFTMNLKPKLPEIFGINKYFDATGAFITNYTWNDPLQRDPELRDKSKSAQMNNQIRFNTTLRLKALGNQWFGDNTAKKNDSAANSDGGIFSTIGNIFRTVLFDYDNMTLSFRQENNANNPGVIGGTGITNFWARGLLFRKEEPIFGPSMAYQLGLVESPFGGFSIRPSGSFPFFRFEIHPGLRPPDAILNESFSQGSTIEARTNRPLWEGATLDLNWRSQFGFNKTQTVVSNSQGIPSFQNIAATENYNRSYFHIPSFLLFGLGNNTVEHVVDLYRERSNAIDASAEPDTLKKNQQKLIALTESFRDGLESFNFWPAALRTILPAVNWSIRWEGIEKWGLWSGIAKRVSLEHTYASTYTENASSTDNGRIIQGQQVQYGFQPLVGLSFGFDEKPLKGLLTTTLRYNTKTSYMLNSSGRSTISREASDELSIQANYSRRGFKFPIFGFELENDIEFSFMTSYRKNRRSTFDVLNFDSEQGRRLDGTTQITIEPRARYTISNRVTASAFYRYEGNFTEGAAQPGFSTTQVGVDLRISVSGGR